MDKNKEILLTMDNFKKQKESLNLQINLGIIDIDGAGNELEMIKKKEQTLKLQLVYTNHVTADGLQRKISHHEPTPNNPKEYWSTKMPDGRKLKAVSYDGLIDKLYSYYADGLADFSFKTVYKAALLEKSITENPKQNTIKKNEADFKRFIPPSLADKDIRCITDLDLKKFIQDWVNKEHPKQKAFLSVKGVLNLAFNYACMHKLIADNPVNYIKNKPYMKSCDTRKAKPEEKILSPEEIELLKAEVRKRMTMKKYGDYYINGYAMLFAIETGVRVGELCAIKWSDVKENSIHIHSQQLKRTINDENEFYLVPYTKNEKGESEDGRDFPYTNKLKTLLAELKGKQEKYGIESEFIFCHEDGDWIKTDAYATFLRRLCKSLGFNVTNNHALRMSLNSNVLIPMGVSVADRAAMLGHSIETNLRHYSFAQKDYLDTVKAILDSDFDEGTPREPLKIVNFPKKESPERLISQAF